MTEPPPADAGVYLYCFARPGAADLLPAGGVAGGTGIETLATPEVVGVFSRVALDDYQGAAAEKRWQDSTWLADQACRHAAVIEAVMVRSPVLPVRFGAVFSGPRALANLLSQRGPAVARYLDGMAGKEEWAVKVFLDVERAIAWQLAHDPDLAARHRLLPAAVGTRYLLGKKLRAEALKQVKCRGRALAQQVHDGLQHMSLEVRALPLRAADEAEVEPIFHGACLVAHAARIDLGAYLERVRAEQVGQGLVMESSGPWPPYHFCPSLAELPP